MICKGLYILMLLVVLSTSCTLLGKKDKQNTTKVEVIEKTKTDVLELHIGRGAFHYDKFILKDSVITYYPTEEGFETGFTQYHKKSSQRISNKEIQDLIDHIKRNTILAMKEEYPSPTSDNSALFITITYNEQVKQIFCEDFERSCPEALQYLERQIIKLHKRDLKRINLPG